jgi:hypothetical protein
MARLNPTPEVFSRYGAPMGRNTGPRYLECSAGKLQLVRVPLNRGGYDSGGAYWGLGPPLWYVQDADGNSYFFRARNRALAKQEILKDWPEAKFYR